MINFIDATQNSDFSGDIEQGTQEQYLLSDSMDAALDRWVDGTFAPGAAKKPTKPLNNREKRALNALSNNPIMRENLDMVAGCSNAPELVACLRRRGLEVPCFRVERYDKDGRVCYPGRYELTPEDRPLVRELLGCK